MPSREHEAIVQVVHHQPAVVAELIRDVLGVKLPEQRRARMDSNDLSDHTPAERRADAVVILNEASSDAPTLGVIVEVQLRRDDRKWWSWPAYLIADHPRHNRSRPGHPVL